MENVFRNIKYRYKALIICLLVSLIPLAVVGAFCMAQMKSALTKKETSDLANSLVQDVSLLEFEVDKCEKAMQYLVWNENLCSALKKEYTTRAERYIAYRDSINPLLQTIKVLNDNITDIRCYANDSVTLEGGLIRPLSDVQTQDWYEEARDHYRTVWSVSGERKEMSLVCRVYNVAPEQVVIVKMELDYDRFFSVLNGAGDRLSGILLTDEEGETVYRHHPFEAEDILEGRSAQYVSESAEDVCNGWKFCLYRPTDWINGAVHTMLRSITMIMLVCLALVILASMILSGMIVAPLEKLAQNMRMVEQGKYDITVSYRSKDEVGKLAGAFSSMVRHMNHLINEVMESRILQQQYEIQALQAQINPHFLYNSLSLINGMGMMAGHMEICKVARFLASFYRTALNKEEGTVRQEWENMRSYIGVQSVMHSHSFEVDYQLDESILSYSMLGLLLQPLVENAIQHGIDYIEDDRQPMLKVTGAQTEDMLIFRVCDNGAGISPERLEKILESDSGHYGVSNVHRRVQLVYGKEYGLHYESAVGEGTDVTLTIPKRTPYERLRQEEYN